MKKIDLIPLTALVVAAGALLVSPGQIQSTDERDASIKNGTSLMCTGGHNHERAKLYFPVDTEAVTEIDSKLASRVFTFCVRPSTAPSNKREGNENLPDLRPSG